MEHNRETCGCPQCVVARGPSEPYYKQAYSYLTRPIKYLTEAEYRNLCNRATEDAATKKYGRVNRYRCAACGNTRITVDRDPGVTPAFMLCDAGHPTGPVETSMHSEWYQVPPEMERLATHEFFRPSYEYYRTITDRNCEKHVRDGGLLFRKIGDVLPEGHKFMTGFQDRIPTPSPFDEGDIEDLRELKERVKLFQKGDRRDV